MNTRSKKEINIDKEVKKPIKPILSKIIDLPYLIHNKKVKLCRLKLNDDDENDHENVENYVNKLLASIRTKIKGVSSYQIQVKFSSGKSYSVNAFQGINEVFVMRDFDVLYQNIGEIEELNVFFA
jgi:hypothetical protein